MLGVGLGFGFMILAVGLGLFRWFEAYPVMHEAMAYAGVLIPTAGSLDRYPVAVSD